MQAERPPINRVGFGVYYAKLTVLLRKRERDDVLRVERALLEGLLGELRWAANKIREHETQYAGRVARRFGESDG